MTFLPLRAHLIDFIVLTSLFLLVVGFDIHKETSQTTVFADVSNSHLVSKAIGYNSMDGEAIDIDKDGDVDMVLAMEFRPNAILINDGSGKLVDESKTRFPSSRHDSEDIAIGDFDNDGDYDIIFVSEDDQINEFYENKGEGFFELKVNGLPVMGTSNAVESFDIDQDGDPDLLIGNAGQNFLLINNGGDFVDKTSHHLPQDKSTTQDLEIADVDNDGDLDILEANETYNRLLINDGNGVFNYEKARLPFVNDQTRDADFGDVDNDGDLDIFFSNVDFGGFGNPQNRLLLNDGNGFFSEATSNIPKSSFRTVDSDFIDLNDDTYLDLVCGNRFNGTEMMVLINNGSGYFTDHSLEYFPEMNIYPFDFQARDFNSDGVLDIYICGFRGKDKLLFGKN